MVLIHVWKLRRERKRERGACSHLKFLKRGRQKDNGACSCLKTQERERQRETEREEEEERREWCWSICGSCSPRWWGFCCAVQERRWWRGGSSTSSSWSRWSRTTNWSRVSWSMSRTCSSGPWKSAANWVSPPHSPPPPACYRMLCDVPSNRNPLWTHSKHIFSQHYKLAMFTILCCCFHPSQVSVCCLF